MGLSFRFAMCWFAGTGSAQQISTAKLPVLSIVLKKNIVIKGLDLVVRTCSKEKV